MTADDVKYSLELHMEAGTKSKAKALAATISAVNASLDDDDAAPGSEAFQHLT